MSDDSSSDEEFEVVETKVVKPMGLASLSGLKNLESKRHEQKVQEEESAEGETATIIFKLPNGEAKKHEVRMNKVIENLKVMIEKEYGIPFENQELLVDGKAQPNVFSLSDIKSIQAGKENIITVKEK